MKLTEWLVKQTQLEDGSVSLMRGIVQYGAYLILTVLVGAWTVTLIDPKMVEVAKSATLSLGGVLTVLLGMKLGQNAQENATPSAPAPPTP
jgi:hypothetical protein